MLLVRIITEGDKEWCVDPAALWLRRKIRQVRNKTSHKKKIANELKVQEDFLTSHFLSSPHDRENCSVLLSYHEDTSHKTGNILQHLFNTITQVIFVVKLYGVIYLFTSFC